MPLEDPKLLACIMQNCTNSFLSPFSGHPDIVGARMDLGIVSSQLQSQAVQKTATFHFLEESKTGTGDSIISEKKGILQNKMKFRQLGKCFFFSFLLLFSITYS